MGEISSVMYLTVILGPHESVANEGQFATFDTSQSDIKTITDQGMHHDTFQRCHPVHHESPGRSSPTSFTVAIWRESWSHRMLVTSVWETPEADDFRATVALQCEPSQAKAGLVHRN
ncbi:hypothetical protein E2C01_010512 [Portunus trituberculatus]|uniref:Uncharacterized protein n=1 Tax=Portunus trituberculatus TaxID=210409 RepID=A0A5B7D8K8_PORTR|nr:hypothetical protein [Portunus trituberculatus]